MKKYILFLLLIYSCTDLISNSIEYYSIYLEGNGWIQINKGSDFGANNSFTIQSWFSGENKNINHV